MWWSLAFDEQERAIMFVQVKGGQGIGVVTGIDGLV